MSYFMVCILSASEWIVSRCMALYKCTYYYYIIINNMQTNPDKFPVISFGGKGNNVITYSTFDNTSIHCDDSVLLLGVEFDHLLTCNNHIAGICRKSARQLAVLKRLGHLLILKGKLAIFKSFVECNFNYCPLI